MLKCRINGKRTSTGQPSMLSADKLNPSVNGHSEASNPLGNNTLASSATALLQQNTADIEATTQVTVMKAEGDAAKTIIGDKPLLVASRIQSRH